VKKRSNCLIEKVVSIVKIIEQFKTLKINR